MLTLMITVIPEDPPAFEKKKIANSVGLREEEST